MKQSWRLGLSEALSSALGWFRRTVTPGGVYLLAVLVFGLVLGLVLGWSEFFAPAMVAATLIALASLFLIGRKRYLVDLSVEKERVVAGDPIESVLTVTNGSSTLALPTRLDVPIGPALVEVPVPLLRGSEVFSHPLDIPTERRGLIRVGPVQKIRSSPVGILRSNTTWGRPHRVFVYPKTVALPPTDVGLMRDLEGMESGRTVPDDLSFHAIREYVPGDARNQVHWKSTAKTGQLMVRQYNESVRSEMLVVLGNAERAYIDGEEFELAVSVGASFALRGMQEGRHLSVVTGPQSERQVLARTMRPLKTTSRRALMDGMTRLRWADGGLTLAEIVTEASAARGYGDPVSIAVLVTGSQTTASQIQTAALRLPLGVGALAVRCALDEPPALRVVGGITVITVAVLEDLRHLLLGQVQR